MDTTQKTTLLDFLKTQKLGVISTVHDSTPESALVGFVEADNLNLYFQTQSTTRKAANLAGNAKIAFVIGTALEAATTVQYEGTVEPVTDEAEKATAKQLFIDKDSPSVRFFDVPTTVMYKVTPTWLRYSNYGGGPPQVFEVTDF